MKYESCMSYSSKVIRKVKVFSTDRQTDKRTNRSKTRCPRNIVSGGIKIKQKSNLENIILYDDTSWKILTRKTTCEISANCFNQSNIYTLYEVLGDKNNLNMFSKLLKKSSKKRRNMFLFSFEYCILSTVFI